MIYAIEVVNWKDVIFWEGEVLRKEKFVLPRQLSVGFNYYEDSDKLVLVSLFDLDPGMKKESNDFIVIPKTLIEDRVTVGYYDSNTGRISEKKKMK